MAAKVAARRADLGKNIVMLDGEGEGNEKESRKSCEERRGDELRLLWPSSYTISLLLIDAQQRMCKHSCPCRRHTSPSRSVRSKLASHSHHPRSTVKRQAGRCGGGYPLPTIQVAVPRAHFARVSGSPARPQFPICPFRFLVKVLSHTFDANGDGRPRYEDWTQTQLGQVGTRERICTAGDERGHHDRRAVRRR